MDRIEKLVDEVVPLVTEIRQKIHANPELSGKEFETAALIRETLAGTAIELQKPFLETDVVGMLAGKGKENGRNITLRADIDALPLTEETGVPYRSKNEGVMHACGHEGHTAMVLGAALVLDKLRDTFNGSVRFVFQPGEEGLALGKNLVEAGAIKDPPPAMAISIHAWPKEDAAVICGKSGSSNAGALHFSINIKGRGGHGAHPEFAIDPILTAARVIEGLQAISSRMIGALTPVVVSICKIKGGMNANVIPNEVNMSGTTRFHDPALREKIPELMEQITSGICQSMGASHEISYDACYLPLYNDPGVIAFGKEAAKEILGEENWVDLKELVMGAEDFSYYLQDCPGAQFRIGVGKDSANLHNSKFNFNDAAIKNGVYFLVAFTLKALKKFNG